MAIKPIPSAQYQAGWRRDTRIRDVVINEEEDSERLCTVHHLWRRRGGLWK